MFLAWRYGGDVDVYCLYNGLDRDYRPLGHPEEAPRPPTYPSRLRMFLYGCGLAALKNESKLAGNRQSSKVARALGGG